MNPATTRGAVALLALTMCVVTGCDRLPPVALPGPESDPAPAFVPSAPVTRTAPPLAAPDDAPLPPEPLVAPRPTLSAAPTQDVRLVSSERPVPATVVPADAPPAAVAEPGGIRLLIPERTFRGEGRPRALRVSYDDLDLLRVLNMDPVPADAVLHFPDWLRDLDGRTVRLRGFMYPAYEEPLKAFILARDNQICCFGRFPKIYDLVTVELAPSVTTRYIEGRPFDVIGTFHIAPVRQGDQWLQLYTINDATIAE